MGHLVEWCDEAALVHWVQDDNELPFWTEADGAYRKRAGVLGSITHRKPIAGSRSMRPRTSSGLVFK
jgi:hypothetical protein